MQRKTAMLLCLMVLTLLCGSGAAEAEFQYVLTEAHPDAGRQGICTEAGYYWVSGSGTLAKYDGNWRLLAENTDPFEGYTVRQSQASHGALNEAELLMYSSPALFCQNTSSAKSS